MSTNTPFSRNTGSNIPGTQKIGNISYGTPTEGFENSSLKWWNGPDEDLGYIIAYEDSLGQHIGGDEIQAYLGFRRSTIKTEASFLQLVSDMFNQTFPNGDLAKTWLNNNGYWTSWGISNSSPLSGAFAYTLVTLPYQPPTAGNIIFPNFSGGVNGNQGLLNPNTFATNAVWWNKIDSTGTDRSSDFNQLIGQNVTISFTQNGNTATYTTNGIVLADGQYFNYSPNTPQSGFTMTLITPSPVDFVAGQLVTISYSII